MSDADTGAPESHGVYGGTPREDGKMQEEPGGSEGGDEVGWAEDTETGGDAT
jgi:hypothetical protein